MNDFLIWISGVAAGFVGYHYFLGRPMARLLGFEKRKDNEG
jgi:hypothetical protein